MQLRCVLVSVFVVVGSLLIASGCGRPSAANLPTSAKTATAGNVERVLVGHPQRKTLTITTTQPGRIEPEEEAPLFPKLAGYVEEVLVDIGDPVRKDQLLLKLWIPEMKDEQSQKEALLAQAEAEVEQAEAAVKAAQAAAQTAAARVVQAEAGIGRADGEYERWKSEHERIRELAGKGSVTQKLVEETLSQFRAAEASREEAVANIESVKAGLNEAQANVLKARADHGAAQAQLRVAAANLQYTRSMMAYREIKAPFDGVITRRGVDIGHYVHPAGAEESPLMVVARTDRVRIVIDIPELEAGLVDAGESGDSVTIRIQSLNRAIESHVSRTSWSLDKSNRSLRVEVDLPNKEGALRPGMYVTAGISLEERKDALTLPITSIVRNGQETYCCLIESGKAARSAILLGLRSGTDVEVLSGVTEAQTVAITRAESLKDGQLVEITEPP